MEWSSLVGISQLEVLLRSVVKAIFEYLISFGLIETSVPIIRQ
jgi:hypothetical protein